MRAKPRSTYRPQLEALEDRQLLAVSMSLRSGVLTLRGTNAADLVAVMSDGDRVLVGQPGGFLQGNGFDADRVDRIVFRGLRGNDFFMNNTNIPSDASGGPGRDLLLGGSAADRLFGGPGNDVLIGDGNDLLNGGPGNNRIQRASGLFDLGFFDPGVPGATNLTGPSIFGATNFGAFSTTSTASALTGLDFPGLRLTSLTGLNFPNLNLTSFPTNLPFGAGQGSPFNTIPGLGSSIIGLGGLLDATALIPGVNGARNLRGSGVNTSLFGGVPGFSLASSLLGAAGRLF